MIPRVPLTTNLRGNGDKPLRVLVWVYFFLLMVEGALRKWILPQFSDPLLLVRDPILICIYIIAIARGRFPFNGITAILSAVGVLSVIAGLTVGSRSIVVTGYGFDAMFLHLPLIFVVQRVMDHDDVVSMGKAVLWFCVPMAVLMVLQFRSPPTAMINCGAGGGIGGQIGGALGKIRPPGLFTFITGAAQFLALASVFVLYGFWRSGSVNRVLLFVGGICICVSAAVSTSRLAIGGIGVVILMLGVVVMLDKRGVSRAFGMLVPVGVILLIATNLDIFNEGREVFEVRLEEAGDRQAGVVGTASNWTARIFGDFYGGVLALDNAPLFGAGLGVGTNVGARFISGQYGFLLAEGEWARVVLEIGPILATPYLFARLWICGVLYKVASNSARDGNSLPMLLFGSCVLLVVVGQFSQTSTLGFATLGAGLCLAAANHSVAGRRDVQQEEDFTGGSCVSLRRKGCADYARYLRGV